MRIAPVLLALLTLLATAACGRDEAPPTAPAPTPTAPQAPSGPAPLAPVDPATELGLMSRPALLTVNGASTGRVFVDGRPVAEAIPAHDLDILPGRHNVQALVRDGHELTPPAPTLLREGSSIILYVRPMNRDGRPLTDLDRIELIEGGVRTADDDLALEGSAGPPPASVWPGRWSGSDQTTEAAPTPAEGSAEPTSDGSAADQTPADPTVLGAGEGSAPAEPLVPSEDGSGTASTADTTAETTEGSAAPVADTVWAELIINSQPVGAIFIDGMRTPWYTPARIRLPERRYSVQVLYDDGSLSRHLEPPITSEAVRQVDFSGTELLVIR